LSQALMYPIEAGSDLLDSLPGRQVEHGLQFGDRPVKVV
jgi:hypothetical protein